MTVTVCLGAALGSGPPCHTVLPVPVARCSPLFVGKKIGSYSLSVGDPEFKSGLYDSLFLINFFLKIDMQVII